MGVEEHELVQDLRCVTAAVEGDDVIVSVYGGQKNVCGTVRFTFSDPAERERTVMIIERWAVEDQMVTLLAANGNVSLFSERSLFERAASA